MRAVPFWLLTTLLLAACDPPTVQFVDPRGAGRSRGLTVVVPAEEADSALARELGWENGVPGAVVQLHRIGTKFDPEAVLADSTGVARFPNALEGYYRLAAHRVTTAAEAAAIGGLVRAFGDGRRIRLAGPATVTLSLGADRRGSLVMSELYPYAPFIRDVDYDFAQYYEVYNNADTTVHLDGLAFGAAWDIASQFSSFPCAETEPFRDDARGVWARFWHRFPGTGNQYPLQPREVAVIAMDAVDHSQVDPRFPDLSGADFELFSEGADVDNPAVPNMPEAGVAPWPLDGHGLRIFTATPVFLALPVDVERLEQRTAPTGWRYALIPAERILDVVLLWPDNPLRDQQFVPCERTVNREFDRLEGGFHHTPTDLTLSFHRRVLFGGPTGGLLLQDVNTSFVDFRVAKHSPGWIEP